MAKTKVQKREMLDSYVERLKGGTGVIMLSTTGLTPKDVNTFKGKLETVGSSYGVVKNTLFKLALKQLGMPDLDTLDLGPHSVVFVDQDIAGAAKLVKEFIKTNKDKVVVKAGILDNQALSADKVDMLAELPTKEQSVAMIAGLLDQSLSGVVNVLEDSMRSLVIILDQAFKAN